MEWGNVTLLALGLGLYCLALILLSTSLQQLRFMKIVALEQLHAVPSAQRVWLSVGALAASAVLIGTALDQTINNDRSAFEVLTYVGAMLIAIRMLGFFFTHVSLIVVEIKTTDSALNFGHLRRSPLILGGTALLFVGLVVPFAIDAVLKARFDVARLAAPHVLEEDIKREGFAIANYIERPLIVEGERQPEQESAFFRDELRPGRRFVIVGDAGTGKTWFLIKMRLDVRSHDPGRLVIFVRGKDLNPEESVLGPLMHAGFGALVWCARPVASKLLAGSLIVIDGLDEMKPGSQKAVAKIAEFAADKTVAAATIIVTTRPTILTALQDKDFKQVKIPNLELWRSEKELNARSGRMAQSLPSQLGQWPPDAAQTAGLFYKGPAVNWSRITGDDVARLYGAFAGMFWRTERDPYGGDERVPFLRTYRDFDILDRVFVAAITGKLFQTMAGKSAPRPHTSGEMRAESIERFVKERIFANYFHLAKDRDPTAGEEEAAQRIVDELVNDCVEYTRLRPQATTFSFGTLLDEPLQVAPDLRVALSEILVESEIVNERRIRSSRIFTFDNQALDEYFLARAQARIEAIRSTRPE